MESTDLRCIVLPIEADRRYSVRGLIQKGYVRVQSGKNDFFIPGNLFRKAAFMLKPLARLDERSISIERLTDAENGAKRFKFTIRAKDGETKTAVIAGVVVDEIVERIDQVKALLHSYAYEDDEASSPYEETDDELAAAEATA